MTATTTREAIDALRGTYEFREPDAVRTYLAQNPDRLGLLAEAATKIPEFLPPDGPIVLEVVRDPEDEEGEGGELVAVSPTRLGWARARPGMERLRREWLITTPGRMASRFNIGVEYY